MLNVKVEDVRTILERTFMIPVDESDAQEVLNRLDAIIDDKRVGRYFPVTAPTDKPNVHITHMVACLCSHHCGDNPECPVPGHGVEARMLADIRSWRVAPTLHWSEAFVLWLKQTPTQKRTERSAATLEAYVRDVTLFSKWFEQVNDCPFSPDLLNATDAKAYFDGLRDKGSAATHNRKLASVRMLVAWAREMGLLDVDPCAWIPRMDAMRESPRDVADDDFRKLDQAAETGAHANSAILRLRDALIFRLMAYAGLRIHEVVGLRLDDLHLEQGYIHVFGKGKKHRKVKVKAGRLVNTIWAWREIMPTSLDGTLVTDETGHAICRTTAWRRFAIITKQAGVVTTPHAMRHTFIYRLIDMCMKRGMHWAAAIKTVCLQTGDTPDVILEYYSGARESDILAVMEAM